MGLVCAVVLALAGTGTASASEPVTSPAALGGVALHPWRLGPDTTPLPFWPLRDPAKREAIFSAIQAMGIKNARVDLRWYMVEPLIKGVRDWSEFDAIHKSAMAHGVTLLPIVAMPPSWANGGGGAWTFPKRPQDFEDFMTAAIERYPDIPAWEIWNEPNLIAFSQPVVDPAKFVDLLAAAHRAKLRAESGTTIISGGLLSTGSDAKQFFEQMIKLHAFDYVDGFAIHPYGPAAPDALYSPFLGLPYFHDRLVQIGKPNVGIWLTEYGASTSAVYSEYGPPMDGTEQASRLRSAFAIATRWPWVKDLIWYEFQDLCTDPNDVMCNFGVVREDMSPKPAAGALYDVVHGQLPKLQSTITLRGARTPAKRSRNPARRPMYFSGKVQAVGADRPPSPITLTLTWARDARSRPAKRRTIELKADDGRYFTMLNRPKPGYWRAVATVPGTSDYDASKSDPVTVVVKKPRTRR